MRNLGPSWKLKWSDDLPVDTLGQTDFWRKTITLREGMSFEERRCTITHEVEHVLRGPTSSCLELPEEIRVERQASLLLLPSLIEVADSLAFHRGNYELTAEDLWVDPWILEVRLGSLCGLERGYLRRRMDDAVRLG